jgi:hypothetical protein
MNRSDYISKLNAILSDHSKFRPIETDPTEEIKKNLNNIINDVNLSTKDKTFNELTGNFSPGYIYGNAKIHKNHDDPPLRPIISTIPTPCYEISKQLNLLIKTYMPKEYSVSSTTEFINLIRASDSTGLMASLDVESLFTNVPVKATIDIIMDYVYRNETIPPPNISEHHLKELLLICTTQSPFISPDGQMYIQKEGVSMGCILGPTFANFYMGYIEGLVLKTIKPIKYCRYVDDIFVTVQNIDELLQLKDELEKASVLKFTYEMEKDRSLNFLDVHVSVKRDLFHTTVYVKGTDGGECLNFDSLCPLRYKIGVIKSFLHRAYTVCSDWESFHIETTRIRQLLINNNFNIAIIDKTIKDFLNTKMSRYKENEEKEAQIRLYFKGFMSSAYDHQEKVLKKIIKKHVQAKDDRTNISTLIYYKNPKLKNYILKNRVKMSSFEDQCHVVYSYTCDNATCNGGKTYIGYTTNSLETRMKQHSYKGAIRKHHENVHNIRIKTHQILKNVKILQKSPNTYELQILESLLIKEKSPDLNRQDEGFSRILKIF